MNLAYHQEDYRMADVMDKYIDDVLLGVDTETTKKTPQGQYDTSKFRGFTDPKLLDKAGEKSQGFAGSFGAGVQINPNDAVTYLSKEMGIPKEKFIIDDDGVIFYQEKDGQYYKAIDNKLGYYAPDVLQMVAEAGGAGLLGASDVVTGPVPTTLLGMPLLMGGIEMGRQEIAESVRGEEGEYDKGRIALSGVAGFGGEIIPKLLRASKKAKYADDLDQLSPKDLKNLLRDSKDLKVELTLAEATALKSQLMKQQVVGEISPTATKMDEFYKRRRGQIEDAVTSYLNKISPTTDATMSGIKTKVAIENKSKELIKARADATAPLYAKALKNKSFGESSELGNLDYTILAKTIDDMAENQVGKNKTAITNVSDMLYVTNKDGVREFAENPEVLQNIVADISTQIKNANTPGASLQGVDAKVVGKLKTIQKEIKDVLSYNNPDYLEADKLFSELSKPIEKLKNSRFDALRKTKVGEESKIADKIFKDGNVDSIKYAKELLPDTEFKAITKTFLMDTFDNAQTLKGGAKEVNYDSGLVWINNILGSKKKRVAMKAALEPKQWDGLMQLERVLSAAGRVKKTGSDTMAKNAGKEELADSTASKVLSVVDTRPLVGLREYLDKRAIGINANSFVDIIMNPNKLDELKAISKLKVGTEARNSSIAALLSQGGLDYAQDDISSSQQQLSDEQKPKNSNDTPNDSYGVSEQLDNLLIGN